MRKAFNLKSFSHYLYFGNGWVAINEINNKVHWTHYDVSYFIWNFNVVGAL